MIDDCRCQTCTVKDTGTIRRNREYWKKIRRTQRTMSLPLKAKVVPLKYSRGTVN